MKALVIGWLAVLAFLCAGSSVNAQGVVNFANASTVGWSNPGIDRSLRWNAEEAFCVPGIVPGSLVSSNSTGLNFSSLRAALY